MREKVIDLGFATHLKCYLTSPSQIRQLASAKCLKTTVLLKLMLGWIGSGTCALGCASTSVGSSGDQIVPLQVPVDVQMQQNVAHIEASDPWVSLFPVHTVYN